MENIFKQAKKSIQWSWIFGICLLTFPLLHAAEKPLAAGEEGKGPWWMKPTAMKRDGTMVNFKKMPWWSRAAGLKPGESFVVEAKGEARDRMLVRREKFRTSNYITKVREIEAIVLVIDDDGDGSVRNGGDKVNDCYVADYDCDGTVDRMVDYIDDDGDGKVDRMEIRYYADGRLNFCWFSEDLDHDGIMTSLVGYEFGGESFFEGDPYGDHVTYLNKFNPEHGVWSPLSECPFAFYDTDGDGFSETVVRVSAVPLAYDVGSQPDYANSAFWRKWEKEMGRIGVNNIRYSFDVDRGSSEEYPLHYDMGFNLVGSTPYDFPWMRRSNAKRRPPQEAVVIPWKDLRSVADGYRARETGFSWMENVDDSIAIGYREHKQDDYRWEGIFWMWERRFMENTGGPCQKWNMRREWSGKPAERRELYYSEVDRRIHLFGAEEGWIEIGYFGGLGKIGEIRMYDTDKNGYFDRWEVYLGKDPQPVRVTRVADERVRRVDFDLEKLTGLYSDQVLPEAKAANEKLLKAMGEAHRFEVPEGLKKALVYGLPSFQRYAQDVWRELQYQDFRGYFARQAEAILQENKAVKTENYFSGDLIEIKRGKEQMKDLDKTRNTHTAWKLSRALAELDTAYGQGDFDRACSLIGEIGKIAVLQ